MLTATRLRTTFILALAFFLAGPTVAQISITSSFYSAKAGQRETETEYEADDDGNPFTSLPCVTGMLSAPPDGNGLWHGRRRGRTGGHQSGIQYSQLLCP